MIIDCEVLEDLKEISLLTIKRFFYDENRGESKETSFGIKEQKIIHGTMRL
jgi:hypothetical protein